MGVKDFMRKEVIKPEKRDAVLIFPGLLVKTGGFDKRASNNFTRR